MLIKTHLTIAASTFTLNSAVNEGGAIFFEGDSSKLYDFVLADGLSFTNNYAIVGAGVLYSL